MNRFTERAQKVILIAQEEAKRLSHDYVGTEHILLGLVALGEGVAAQVLGRGQEGHQQTAHPQWQEAGSEGASRREIRQRP